MDVEQSEGGRRLLVGPGLDGPYLMDVMERQAPRRLRRARMRAFRNREHKEEAR
jgi:hypothetical protein